MTVQDKEKLIEDMQRILDRRTAYADQRLEKLPDDNSLSRHGMWDQGYWQGYQSGLDAMYDRIMLVLDRIETKEDK
ncbi:MAG: hypothetical protein ACRDDH_11725 [Cetobacterium sp.]|uniref:hypothetical protein n=1 Tax=Cetobacterium sp. TaxID=2071632 RepID=UPI003EE6F910